MRRRILEVLHVLSALALGTFGLIAGISSRPRVRFTTPLSANLKKRRP
jgi:hypothetical protein